MPARFFSRKLLVPAAVAALFAAAPAVAQEEPSELQKVFGAMGLLELPKDPIDYSERSPLVVPPTADLPRPGEADAKQLNPEWPVDQDVKRAAVARKESKKPIDFTTDAFYSGRRPNSDKEIRKSTARGTDSELYTEEEKRGQARLMPDKLGFKGWDKKDDEVKFESEPERTSLLQPPPGYQTPSRNAPYGIVDDSKATSNPGYYDRNDDRNRTVK